jgi:hypothetical protein
MNEGTPKNLHQAIRNGMAAHTGGSVEDWKDEHAEHIRLHVKDFLAQKFQVAKCQAHQGRFKTEDDLQILFDACTKTSTCVNKD